MYNVHTVYIFFNFTFLGPYAHLFHRVHEQTHVAHVMGYAMCAGPYVNNCDDPNKKYHYDTINDGSNAASNTMNIVFILGTLLLERFYNIIAVRR